MGINVDCRTTIQLRKDVTPEQVAKAIKPVTDYYDSRPVAAILADLQTADGIQVLGRGGVNVDWAAHLLELGISGECDYLFTDEIDKAIDNLSQLSAEGFVLDWYIEDDQNHRVSPLFWRDDFYGPNPAVTRKFKFEHKLKESIASLEEFCPDIGELLTAVARLNFEPKRR